MIDRLGLGTVQLGLAYGVANRIGQPSRDEAATIIAEARGAGMDTLDTAIAYGESEMRLGEIGLNEWRVVTKLPAVPDDVLDVSDWVRKSVTDSLARLRVPSLTGLLLHRSADLLSRHGAALAGALRRERDEGRVTKIGVSIYEPLELDAIWSVLLPDLVQAPVSVLDRRLESSGWLARLHHERIEVHARSVFLQGLLIMAPSDRPKKFDRWSAVWTAWSDWLNETGMCAVRSCLAHVLSYPEISRVLVGVDSATQLTEIVAHATAPAVRAPASLATADLDLLDPSRWSAL